MAERSFRRTSSTVSASSTSSTNSIRVNNASKSTAKTQPNSQSKTTPMRQPPSTSVLRSTSSNNKSTTTGTVNGKSVTASTASKSSVKTNSKPSVKNSPKHAPQAYGVKLTLNSLPDEVILKIFRYLAPDDLLRSSLVNRRWLSLSNDNILWRQIYLRYVPKQNCTKDNKVKPVIKDDQRIEDWRKKLFSSCSQIFDLAAILSKMTKIDSFTGFPAIYFKQTATSKVLETLSVRWVLAFVDDNDRETFAFNDDSHSFSMSLCVRWYSFVDRSLKGIKKIRLYAARPVLAGSDGKPLIGSPCKRSLVYEMAFSMWTMIKKGRAIFGDDTISLYNMPENSDIMFATWKQGEDLAFVTASLHFHKLVERSLCGSPTDRYVAPPVIVPKSGDIDSTYGLHGYVCVMELRNHRQSVWRERFDKVHCRQENINAGLATLQLIDPKSSHQRSRLTALPTLLWRTELFKGKLPDVCILDVTLFDEHGNAMWCFSSPAHTKAQSVTGASTYEYDGEFREMEFCDWTGDARVDIVYVREEEECFITDVRLGLSLGFINRWFGTGY